jgi:hypothetical protein
MSLREDLEWIGFASKNSTAALTHRFNSHCYRTYWCEYSIYIFQVILTLNSDYFPKGYNVIFCWSLQLRRIVCFLSGNSKILLPFRWFCGFKLFRWVAHSLLLALKSWITLHNIPHNAGVIKGNCWSFETAIALVWAMWRYYRADMSELSRIMIFCHHGMYVAFILMFFEKHCASQGDPDTQHTTRAQSTVVCSATETRRWVPSYREMGMKASVAFITVLLCLQHPQVSKILSNWRWLGEQDCEFVSSVMPEKPPRGRQGW